MLLLCCTLSCKMVNSFAIAVTGAYETGDADQNPAGATVTAIGLGDDGSTTPVSGQIGTGTTDEEGLFKFCFFKNIKNLIIEIAQNGQTTKCTLLDVQQAEQELPLKAALDSAAAATGSNARFAIVTPETDVATELLLLEVREGTKPDEVNLHDIDELLDAGIADEVRSIESSAMRACILKHIYTARRSSRLLLLEILDGTGVSEDAVTGASDKLKVALPQIQQLHKWILRQIYGLKTSGADPSAIQDLLALERQQVLSILADVDIPAQLYIKAAIIAENEFERVLKTAAQDCDFPASLLNRLSQRSLIRQVQETALQTKSVLTKLFAIDKETEIEAALQEALEAIAALPPENNNRLAIRAIIRDFNGHLLDAIKDVPPTVATDAAIAAINLAMIAQQLTLFIDLEAAQTVIAMFNAYKNYYASFRDTILFELNIFGVTDPALQEKKKALADLLFVLNF